MILMMFSVSEVLGLVDSSHNIHSFYAIICICICARNLQCRFNTATWSLFHIGHMYFHPYLYLHKINCIRTLFNICAFIALWHLTYTSNHYQLFPDDWKLRGTGGYYQLQTNIPNSQIIWHRWNFTWFLHLQNRKYGGYGVGSCYGVSWCFIVLWW